MKYEVKIKRLPDTGKPMKATASVTLDGKYAVHNIRIIYTDKGAFLGMPCVLKKDSEGKTVRSDIFHPVSAEVREEIERVVISAYEDELRREQFSSKTGK